MIFTLIMDLYDQKINEEIQNMYSRAITHSMRLRTLHDVAVSAHSATKSAALVALSVQQSSLCWVLEHSQQRSPLAGDGNKRYDRTNFRKRFFIDKFIHKTSCNYAVMRSRQLPLQGHCHLIILWNDCLYHFMQLSHLTSIDNRSQIGTHLSELRLLRQAV